ncbi:hypothetical protein [Salibacterium sp. K-3]
MMNVKKIPEIEQVFETGIRSYAVEIQRSTIEWAEQLNFLNDFGMLKRYEKQSIGYLAFNLRLTTANLRILHL